MMNMTGQANTKTEMDFIWNKVNDGNGIITTPADRLNRGEIARFLTNYLTAEGKTRNYVLNVNAQWGAGVLG